MVKTVDPLPFRQRRKSSIVRAERKFKREEAMRFTGLGTLIAIAGGAAALLSPSQPARAPIATS
jgi:hypothetical protein